MTNIKQFEVSQNHFFKVGDVYSVIVEPGLNTSLFFVSCVSKTGSVCHNFEFMDNGNIRIKVIEPVDLTVNILY